jgi:hydrogenase maturation protease
MLVSPIILYDYPAVAPESPGDLFDGAEIDEILSLRILTMTDAEKREARETDPRARALLDRTEALSAADLMRMHGAVREPSWEQALRPGAHVRIRPRRGGDVFDLVLEGKAATVEAVERDDQGRLLLAVTIDDDPGRDLGVFGHRFFFHADEVEPLS